jgi:hypothetical protein
VLTYNVAVSNRFPPYEEAEIAAIFARLRGDVGPATEESERHETAIVLTDFPSRRELDRRWAVTAEREYIRRPGWSGAIRNALVLGPKALLRRLMRWYVEPFAADQRAFNATLLRALDDLTSRVDLAVRELQTSVASLDERIARLERTAKPPSSTP